MKFIPTTAFLCLIFLTNFSNAEGVSPYLPLKVDPLIELEIDRLVSIAKMPNLSKPYHIVTVVHYLAKIKSSHPKLYNRLNTYIKRYKKQSGITQLSFELGHSFSKNEIVPNNRGAELDDVIHASIASFYQFNKYLIFNGGGSYADATGFVSHNSYLSFGTEYIQVDLGYREKWLSPAQESAELLSTNAEPIPSITISNVKGITDWNINYEMSFGLLEKMEGIHFDDQVSPGKPGFLTMHFSAQLFDWWSLGVNRSFMFGGGERSINISDIWDAIIDPVSSDNCGGLSDLQDCNVEVGNQIASVTSKFDISILDTPVSIYAEFGGEDTNDYKNYLLGNKGFTLGFFFPYLTSDTSMYLEHTLFEDRWYIHHLYDEGYRNNLRIMGHWWGEHKTITDPVEANLTTFRFNWDLSNNDHLQFRLRTINNYSSQEVDYQRSFEGEINYNFAYKNGFLGLSLISGSDTYGDSYSKISLKYNW